MTTVITVRPTALGRGAEGYMWAGNAGLRGRGCTRRPGLGGLPPSPLRRPCLWRCARSPRTPRSPPARAGDAAVHLLSLPAQLFWVMAVLDRYRELASQGPLCFESLSAGASEFSGLRRLPSVGGWAMAYLGSPAFMCILMS